MKRNFWAWILFLGAFALFAAQTLQAFGIVAFHAELFERKGTIVLDAGHGGEDGGAVGVNGVLEKDVNLAVALELEKYLKWNQFDVIMVRDSDLSVGDQSLGTISARKRSDTKARLRMVEEAGECILISIHQNHFSQSKYSGAQVFYSTNREESAQLAESIRMSIVDSLQPENKRENKPAGENIYLLHNCQMPAVLVECGFLSNPEEAEKLSTDAYQKEMAAAIYNGLIDYLESEKTPSNSTASGLAN